MPINDCAVCLHKQRRIDELEDEVKRLRAKLSCEERKAADGFFGSSTPSSKKPVKPRGAKLGHKGSGRSRRRG